MKEYTVVSKGKDGLDIKYTTEYKENVLGHLHANLLEVTLHKLARIV